jgi:hypothetical protein
MAMRGHIMTLWILFCRMSKGMDILFTFYASDQEQAEQLTREILKEHPYERLDLKAYPYGFVMHRSRISGMIEEESVAVEFPLRPI